MPKYIVTGPLKIGGVPHGGVVELDPEKIDVSVLIDAGHIEPAPAPKPAAPPLKKNAGGESDS